MEPKPVLNLTSRGDHEGTVLKKTVVMVQKDVCTRGIFWNSGNYFIKKNTTNVSLLRCIVCSSVFGIVNRVPTLLESPGFFGYNFQVLESPGKCVWS